MKKLIALLLLSPLAYADMDKICRVFVVDVVKEYSEIEAVLIKRQCERNNVLALSVAGNNEYTRENLLNISNLFCRFDRNRSIEGSNLSCILYDNKARKYSFEK
ncbi:hypothetical protein OAD71_00100 [Gammaproteobacteria bacterium]|jgi:hypothetical protein|nr:hypothetical protein [Gammaproteobacteria bacterium]MDB9946643.1 hypothetical protein [Gammaproteobacteria bacterium]